MRVGKLDLLRYGRFTDVSLGFPATNPDVHIIFGPNEAGKSTSLAAIEDLLFGVRHNSPYNFVHDYGSMRVGGVLEHNGKTLEVRRRKGNRDTLLRPDETPLTSGDSALMPFLSGADQTFFTRMFSLNHERLAKGGREILEAKDEVGQTLFSAGAGLSGLHGLIAALIKEADNLWAPRRAAHRKYYKALDALEGAEKALREHTITASKWQEIKRSCDADLEVYDDLEKEIESRSAEQRKLSRIRRVYREVRRLTALDEEVAALGMVVLLPDDADKQLVDAEQEESDARSRVEELTEQLSRAREDRTELRYDETLLLLSDDIQQLHKQRIEVQKEKSDLPKRRAELASAEARLQRLAEELGWEANDTDDLIARIPQRARITAVRTLLTHRGERASATENAKDVVQEAEAHVEDIQRELDGTEGGVAVSALAAVIGATRDFRDIGSRIKAAEKEVKRAQAAIPKRLKPLRPQVSSEQALVEIAMPPRTSVQDHRDLIRELEQQAKSCRDRIRKVEQEIAQHRKRYDRLARDEAVVGLGELARARRERDAGWSLIRRHYIEEVAVPEEELTAFVASAANLPEAYEGRVKAADTLADRRFNKAQAAGEIAVIARQIAEQQELLDSLHEQERALREDSRALEEAWQQVWAEAPFEPLAPDLMLNWLDARDEVLDTIESSAAAARQITALKEEESDAKATIIAELTALDEEVEGLKGQPLSIVLEAGSAVQQRHEKSAESRSALQDRLCKAQADEGRKQVKLKKAEAAWSKWQDQWVAGVKRIGLGEDALPEVVADQLDAIDDMRAVATDINQLQHERIGKIERDIESFNSSVTELVRAAASDVAKLEPEDAVFELEKRLEESKRIRDQQRDKDKAIASLEKRIEECEEVRRDARKALRKLQDMADVEEIDQLREAINKSRRRRELDDERTRIVETLATEGDGLTLPELSQECEVVDLDQVAVREETLQQELDDLRGRLMEAAERRTQSRQAFEAIGGDDRAARAAAAKQEALATMRDVAEQYVRIRSAATLLQWAIDRYRREKQAPLLKRAGEMFAILTLGSFIDLRVEFEDQDRAHLAGTRPDGTSVSVGGMSDGTSDQLYLALRLASVDEYLSRAHPLPFVADDLFVNFDDSRAAAGFEVLGQLGRTTQVLFFTHHQHLVEIARATLGKSINVILLEEDNTVVRAQVDRSGLYEAS